MEEQEIGFYLNWQCAKCGSKYGDNPGNCHGCGSNHFIQIEPEYQSLSGRVKTRKKIVEIIEVGFPCSIVQREGEETTDLIDTELLVEELNQMLRMTTNRDPVSDEQKSA